MAKGVVAVAAISLQHHAAEALPEVAMPEVAMPEGDIPQVATAMPEGDMPGVGTLGLEWGRMALDRAPETRSARAPQIVIGTATTTGTMPAVIGEIRMANGVGGMATGGFIPGRMSCSLAILAFPGGGVGAGARGPAGDGAAAIRMDITATAILTTAAMVTRIMVTAMDTVPSTSLSMETAANPEWRSCSSDSHALVITKDPLTESSGHKRSAQSARTNRRMAT